MSYQQHAQIKQNSNDESTNYFYHTMICKVTSLSVSHGSRESNPSNSMDDIETLQCTDHMCPIRVHWHVKNNYMSHWRVKLTVSNYNYQRNYSDWNVLIQHPNFKNLVKTFSFNNTLLPAAGLGGTFFIKLSQIGF